MYEECHKIVWEKEPVWWIYNLWLVWVMRYWRGYLSGARCKWFACGPANATASTSSLASLKSRLVWTFCCWLTLVVLEKNPLNEYLSVWLFLGRCVEPMVDFGLSPTWNHHHTTTVLRPFFLDHPGEPVPKENSWTLWYKGKLTQAGTLTIRLGATPSGLTSAYPHHPICFLRARCPSCCPTNSDKALKAPT